MRGKNILWLSMIAMLLSVMVVNIGSGQEETLLKISPGQIPGKGKLGRPGDVYHMSVEIENVTNLWTVGFEIHIAPFVSVLAASNFSDGGFLSEGWPPGPWYPPDAPVFELSKRIDALNGIIYVVLTRLEARKSLFESWPREGASGSGTLMTFDLTVLEAGPSPIELVNTVLLDPDLNPIPHQAKGSKYRGSYARIRPGTGAPRFATVGETFNITSQVENRGDIPLYVRMRFDIERIEDGRRIQIRSGQTYYGGYLGAPAPTTYLYVDGYYTWIEGGWDHYKWTSVENETVGTGDNVTTTFWLANAPIVESTETVYLNGTETTDYTMNYTTGEITFDVAPDVDVVVAADYAYKAPGWSPWLDTIDGNVISSIEGSSLSSMYTFENLTLPWEGYNVISDVDIQGYTMQIDLDNDFDPYFFTYTDETGPIGWMWGDSLGGSNIWAWTGPRYYDGTPYDMPEYYGFPDTLQAVNNAEVLLHNYDGDEDPGTDLMAIDAMRLRIEFATITPVTPPVFVVQPGEKVYLDVVSWVTVEDHIGTYKITATVEYTSEFVHWNSWKSHTKTFRLDIVP